MRKHTSMGLMWTDIQTDTAIQLMRAIAVFWGMILTCIPLWEERSKSDSSLQQFDFWSAWCLSYRGPRFNFHREYSAKWTWDSLVVCIFLQSPCWSTRAAASCWQQSHAQTKCSSGDHDEHAHNIMLCKLCAIELSTEYDDNRIVNK